MAPKPKPGRTIHCDGLPEGWQCVEKEYLSGPLAGQKYLRFQTAIHRNILSLKAAIKLQAKDDGIDPDEAARQYEERKEQAKLEAQRQRESSGILKGEKREAALEHFRATYGPLNGACVPFFPGWKGESKILEKCGQICATYYNPEGQVFKLLKDIEAYLGSRMMQGIAIPDIELARNSVTTDENGKKINVTRHLNIVEEFTKTLGRKTKKRQIGIVTDADYQETPHLKVLKLANVSAAELQKQGVQNSEEVQKAVGWVQDAMVKRGFPQSTELVYVTGSPHSRTAGKEALDRLSGIYYEREDTVNDRPHYQYLATPKERSSALTCSPLYLFWSSQRNGWKIGAWKDNLAGLALCCQDKMRPAELDTDIKWQLLLPAHEAED